MSKADFYIERGFSVIPIIPGTKKPAVEWKQYTERKPTSKEIQQWSRFGIALVMGSISGYVAVDADSKEDARKLWHALPRTDCITVTPNGGHFIYRCNEEIRPAVKTTIKGIQCDIRGEGSYLIAAPSIHPSGKPYSRWGEWQSPPEFCKNWIEKRVEFKPRNEIRYIDRYLEKIQSIEGSNGSAGLVRAAHVCRDNDLSQSEATIALISWNGSPAVNPPWSHKEIARAITRVYENH